MAQHQDVEALRAKLRDTKLSFLQVFALLQGFVKGTEAGRAVAGDMQDVIVLVERIHRKLGDVDRERRKGGSPKA